MFLGPGSRQQRNALIAPRGTQILFRQTSAPLGWTKVTTFNDALMRVVSGTASNGGSNGFVATFNAQTVTGNTTLTTAQLASHQHATPVDQTSLGGNGFAGGLSPGTPNQNTGAAGGGGSHNHTITTSILYVDVIIAKKT